MVGLAVSRHFQQFLDLKFHFGTCMAYQGRSQIQNLVRGGPLPLNYDSGFGGGGGGGGGGRGFALPARR